MAWGGEEILGIFWIREDMVEEVVGLLRGPPLDQLPSEEELRCLLMLCKTFGAWSILSGARHFVEGQIRL